MQLQVIKFSLNIKHIVKWALLAFCILPHPDGQPFLLLSTLCWLRCCCTDAAREARRSSTPPSRRPGPRSMVASGEGGSSPAGYPTSSWRTDLISSTCMSSPSGWGLSVESTFFIPGRIPCSTRTWIILAAQLAPLAMSFL